ncbi:unnamed protein product [Didymodactylos carnosus]|uniref:Uncharacterized protein n=1 Tax=Didymodactylos carnosus TaxID=1234261 RepID=A0A815MQS7_9BILA|nr:unnamed protein product [Didymodactylos carnosus]CAF4306767.1 unnamed protein product [Didymodactylos carnosus]
MKATVTLKNDEFSQNLLRRIKRNRSQVYLLLNEYRKLIDEQLNTQKIAKELCQQMFQLKFVSCDYQLTKKPLNSFFNIINPFENATINDVLIVYTNFCNSTIMGDDEYINDEFLRCLAKLEESLYFFLNKSVVNLLENGQYEVIYYCDKLFDIQEIQQNLLSIRNSLQQQILNNDKTDYNKELRQQMIEFMHVINKCLVVVDHMHRRRQYEIEQQPSSNSMLVDIPINNNNTVNLYNPIVTEIDNSVTFDQLIELSLQIIPDLCTLLEKSFEQENISFIPVREYPSLTAHRKICYSGHSSSSKISWKSRNRNLNNNTCGTRKLSRPLKTKSHKRKKLKKPKHQIKYYHYESSTDSVYSCTSQIFHYQSHSPLSDCFYYCASSSSSSSTTTIQRSYTPLIFVENHKHEQFSSAVFKSYIKI